jgi:hypothetical protein
VTRKDAKSLRESLSILRATSVTRTPRTTQVLLPHVAEEDPRKLLQRVTRRNFLYHRKGDSVDRAWTVEVQLWSLRSEEEDFRTTTRQKKSLWRRRAERSRNNETRCIKAISLLHLRCLCISRLGHACLDVSTKHEFGGAFLAGSGTSTGITFHDVQCCILMTTGHSAGSRLARETYSFIEAQYSFSLIPYTCA